VSTIPIAVQESEICRCGGGTMTTGLSWAGGCRVAVGCEEALTAAVIQRYHVDVAMKRALGAKLGSLRDKTAARAAG
jgi:hypothetical protein